MATTTLRAVSPSSSEMSWVQRYMIRRFHPRRIMLDGALMPWVVYFVWNHNWPLALLFSAVSLGLGYWLTQNVDVATYSRTVMGKMAILHLQPANVSLQALGLIWMVVALWNHQSTGILGSLSVIFLGHLAGWDKVFQAISERAGRQEVA